MLKISEIDAELKAKRIKRLELIKSELESIAKSAPLSQSSTYFALQQLTENGIIRDDEEILSKIQGLLSGENNQKVVLDNPKKTIETINVIMGLVDNKIRKLQV